MFEQIFHFRYADGAQMLTVGGVIVTPGVRQAFEGARFDEFDYVSRDEAAAEITAPPLTAKEALHLNRQLPLSVGVMLDCPGLDEHDLEGYRRYYRWYPRIPAAP